MEAPIKEIFFSIQGEGPYVGTPQIFIRFSGCNLNCDYCDTSQKRNSRVCNVETTPGKGEFSKIKNPISIGDLHGILKEFPRAHSISLTGGEPLLYADFIMELETDLPIYLESNMSLPENAIKVKDKVSIVAGDIKTRDSYGGDDYDTLIHDQIESFRILKNMVNRDTFCKIVVSSKTDPEELYNSVDAIKDYISMVVLQPMTPLRKSNSKPMAYDLIRLREKLGEIIPTRVIPQTHKMWGAL